MRTWEGWAEEGVTAMAARSTVATIAHRDPRDTGVPAANPPNSCVESERLRDSELHRDTRALSG